MVFDETPRGARTSGPAAAGSANQLPCILPPSNVSTSPVMYDESAFDARKTKAGEISSGCAGRRIGTSDPCSAASSAGLSATFSGVHTGPGAAPGAPHAHRRFFRIRLLRRQEHDRDVRAFARVQQRNRAPDAGIAPGDERSQAKQLVGLPVR